MTAPASASTAPPFDVSFDRVMTFSSHRTKLPAVLVSSLGDAPLVEFQQQLGRVMQTCGLARGVDACFMPHVTLHYVSHAAPDEEVPIVSWRVTEFLLIHSLLGRSEHHVLGRWPL